MVHRAQATVNRAALAHNLAVAKRHAPHAKVVAVIKANAYGHGLLPVAEALHGADMFGVTDVEEAELLRRGGCDKDIPILQGLIEAGDIDLIGEHGYQLVIHDHVHLQWLEAAFDRKQPRAPLRFWLKLDSGMGRLGLRNQDYLAVCRALLTKPWTAGVVTMTHFASASDPEAPLNIDQLTR